LIRDSGPPGTDAILLGVDRVRFLDSGAVMRMAQNRPLFAALLTGSLALHMFALLLLNWLEQAPTATKTSLEIPVELVSDPGASGKGSGQHAAAAGQKIAEAKPKPTAQTKQPQAPKPEPPKPAQTQPLKLPQQPEQPKAAAAPTQQKPAPQANQPKPAAQPHPPAQPAAAAQRKPSTAGAQPKQPAPVTPPAATQSSGIPTMATLQMQAMHPSAAQLPFSMEENYQAVAVPSPNADGDLLTSYKTLVFSMLELAKQFPADARARGAQGTATVYFEIDNNGGVKSVKLVQSSGDTELDVESLAVVERAAPFPKPPRGAQRAFAAEIEFDPGEPAH
jgi:colicin import membrane protein